MKKLYAKEVEAVQGNKSDDTEPVTPSPSPDNVTPIPTPPQPDLTTPREREITQHVAPNGTVELATRPATFPGHPEIYSKKDIEKEKELQVLGFPMAKRRMDWMLS